MLIIILHSSGQHVHCNTSSSCEQYMMRHSQIYGSGAMYVNNKVQPPIVDVMMPMQFIK